MSNIVADADVGLLFFIPGIDETLRINGMARLSREPELLAAAATNGREPRLIILVTVREAFLHCGKALKRSRLWQDDYRVDKRSFPSLGRMIVEQTKPATVTVEQADAFIADNYVTGAMDIGRWHGHMPWAIYFDRSGSGVRIVSSCIVLGEARVKAANGKIRAGSGFQLGRDLRHMSSLESRAREFILRGHAAAVRLSNG